MAFPSIETPRTEFGDQTNLLNGAADIDFSTQNSIPSPSKDGNDLIKHLRGMRAPNGNRQSPRSRLPLVERRNAPSKNEFTPLLKSAARNRQARHSGAFGKENQMQTPTALKASYRGGSSPPLPLNSSIIREEQEFTGSELADGDGGRTPMPPASSSSAMSTPMMLRPRTEEEARENGRNLATLREQEAVSAREGCIAYRLLTSQSAPRADRQGKF